MAENNNALAWLAKVMNEPVDMASIHDRGLVVLNAKQFSAYQKAQRIVSVLASHYEPCFPAKSGDDVIDECRAIAEEGGAK